MTTEPRWESGSATTMRSSTTPLPSNIFFTGTIAIEGLLSFGDLVAIGALIELHKPIGNASGLKWLYGGGAYFGFGAPNNFGAQGILGLDYKIPSIPLNLSLDWKPELNFVSDFGFEPAAVGFSARFTIR